MELDLKDLDRLSDNQLKFLNKHKLNDDQLAIALAVDKEARRQKINPDFVWPMVYQESEFNPNAVSPKGAFGVMQLEEETANGLKVDRKDIEQNIRGGVSLLKELMSTPGIGNDPYKVLAGYNASTKTRNAFYQSKNLDDLPDETLTHMYKVAKNFGGDLPDVNLVTQEEAKTTQENPNVKTINAPKTADVDLLEPPADITGSAPYAVMGGYGGAKIAGGIESGKKVLPILHNVLNKVTNSDAYMYRPQSTASLQRYLNSQIEPNLRLPLSELEKLTSRENPIRTMSEVQDALAEIKGSPRTGKTVSINPATGQPRQIFTQPKAPVDLSAYKYTPTAVTKIVDEAKNAGEMVKGALPSAGRVGFGVMGGALAGSQLYDAMNQYRADEKGLHVPTLRNAAQFASGAGGALSTLPFGVTQAVGLALQAPEMAYQGYEGLQELNKRRKQATREDVNNMLMNVDPMGNPMTESPTQQSLPVRPAPLQAPTTSYYDKLREKAFEDQRKKMFYSANP